MSNRTSLMLSVKLHDDPHLIDIGRVDETHIEISPRVTLEIYRQDRETMILAHTEVPNPEGPHPTKTETECVYSFLHAPEPA